MTNRNLTRHTAVASRRAASDRHQARRHNRCLSPAIRIAGLLLLTVIVSSTAGCSLGVIASKVLLGDPKKTCDFTAFTNVDLTDREERLLVLCSTPNSIRDSAPSIELDLLDGITRRLKVRDIIVVPPDDVATWKDDHGSLDNLDELAEHFKAHFVVHIDLQSLSYREDGSPNLFRGQAGGHIRGYQVMQTDELTDVVEIYVTEFNSIYPLTYPVSADQKSETLFQKEYLDRLCLQLAQKFYDHRYSEEIE